jgi:hypothetical protein
MRNDLSIMSSIWNLKIEIQKTVIVSLFYTLCDIWFFTVQKKYVERVWQEKVMRRLFE